jgi:adenine-specific DNA-methyltransferase
MLGAQSEHPLPVPDGSPHVYSNDLATIHHGESLGIMADLPSECADLIFVDPPYNIGKQFGAFRDTWPNEASYVNWCYEWLTQCLRLLKPTGSLYVMTSTQAMPYLDIWLRERTTILSRIMWHYDSSGVQAKKYYGSMYEPILFCVKDPRAYTFNADEIEVEARTGAVRKLIDYRKDIPAPYKTTKIPGNVWYFPRVRYRMAEYEEHPSQKPEGLMERIIRASSKPGDLIIDPFAGTCTTGAVAQKLARRSISIEAQLPYVKIGLRRLSISQHHGGEELIALDKSYTRRNANGVRAISSKQNQTGLFEV